VRRREEEGWREAALEHLPFPFAVARVNADDPLETRFVFANRATREASLPRVPELVGRTLREIYPGAEDLPPELDFATMMADVARTGEPRLLEMPLSNGGDEPGVIRIQYYRVGEGLVGVAFENLAKQRAQAADDARAKLRLRATFQKSPIALLEEDFTELFARLSEFESPDALRVALDSDPDLLAQLGSTIRVLAANEAAVELFEAETEVQLLSRINELLLSRPRRLLCDQLVALAEGTRQLSAEYDYATLGGRRVRARLTLRIERRPSDRVFGWAVIEDLTELTAAHRRLERQAAQLAASNADLERFAYVASHDLQEPLRVITSFSGLLQAEHADALDGAALDYLGFLMEGAERMRRQIEDLLLFSRVMSSPTAIAPVDPRDAMRLARDNLSVAFEESSVELVLPDAAPEVLGSTTQLARVFQNLFANAIRFCGEAPPRIEVTAEARGDDVELHVADNGIGFDPSHADEIFEIFRRLNPRGEYAGSGMGLAICKRVLERLGGSIRAEGAPGEGATFILTVPRAPEAEPR